MAAGTFRYAIVDTVAYTFKVDTEQERQALFTRLSSLPMLKAGRVEIVMTPAIVRVSTLSSVRSELNTIAAELMVEALADPFDK